MSNLNCISVGIFDAQTHYITDYLNRPTIPSTMCMQFQIL